VRQEGERRPKAVVGRLIDEAAESGQKPANLTSRLVKEAG
jgi:predicted DNA-binding ribbon-helix-helix protein